MVRHFVSKRCRYWDGRGGSETNNGAWVGERMFVEVEEEVGSGKKVVCTLYMVQKVTKLLKLNKKEV